MTFQHRAGVSPYTSRCRFAWTCVFGKQSHGPFLCNHPARWPYFSRSYVCILPSSLTRILPCACAYSARLPVSVYGTVFICLYSRDYFSARRLHTLRFAVASLARSFPPSPVFPGDFFGSLFRPGTSITRMCFALCVIPSRDIQRCGNIHPLPIGYGFRPRLRGRLTLGQITFTLETLGFRRTGISPVFSLLMPAFSLVSRPHTFSSMLLPYIQCSPTDYANSIIPRLRRCA